MKSYGTRVNGATFAGKVIVGHAWLMQEARVLQTAPGMGGKPVTMKNWPRRARMNTTASRNLGGKSPVLKIWVGGKQKLCVVAPEAKPILHVCVCNCTQPRCMVGL